MKARCPRDPSHKEFYTVAHVMEDWRVDQDGAFIESIGCLEVEHGPDPGNTWTCAVCGADATVED